MLGRFIVLVVLGIALSGVTAVAGPYALAGGQAGSPAIAATSSSIVEWASGATIVRGLRNVENPTAYGPSGSAQNYAFYGGSDGASVAAGASSTANSAPVGMPPQPQTNYYAVALGQGGSATLSFDQPITNGPGYDFAVFGNGFSSGPSLEWCKPAQVAVSSNGVNFFQFPSVSLTPNTSQLSSYGEVDPTNLYDIAGKDPQGWGTPFDLSELANVSPLLNVNAVKYVQILSCTGDINPAYATYDSQGNIINGPWPAASFVGSEGFNLAGVGVLHEVVASVSLTWSNAAGSGIWNIAGDTNWNTLGAGGVAYQDGDSVTFDNSIVSSNQTVTLNNSVLPAAVAVNNSSASYSLTGTGSIAGNTGLTKGGSAKLTLGTVSTYAGATAVNEGTLELAVTGALPAGNALTIASGAQVVVDGNTGPLVLGSLDLDPASTGDTVGKLDLTNNGLIVHNGDFATISAAVKSGANNLAWNGTAGITSSTAAGDKSLLTALGVIQNVNAAHGTIYSTTFDGATGLSLTTNDVLVKYTYYGDTNLDGKVDGSDYTQIDFSFLSETTSGHLISGWYNGDFNYDDVVNGSDYTLIDNAFNNQGAVLTAIIAGPEASATAIVTAPAAVPEPSTAALMGMPLVLFVILGMRRSARCAERVQSS